MLFPDPGWPDKVRESSHTLQGKLIRNNKLQNVAILKGISGSIDDGFLSICAVFIVCSYEMSSRHGLGQEFLSTA